jgi:hypothetical protein
MSEETVSRGSVTLLRPELSQGELPPIEINSGAMLASGASIGAVRLASDLIQFVWWPGRTPFSFEVESLSARLQSAAPTRAWTPWRVRRYRAWAMTFFKDAGNDQWVPIPNYYQQPRVAPRRQVTPAKRAC